MKERPMSLRAPTEPEIASAILRYRCEYGTRGTAMVHYTPAGWWECDVAHFTDAGYLTEYEIKTSRADFRKDANKSKAMPWNGPDRSKHQQIADGYGPKRFWFCTPVGLLTPDEIPEFAGLLEFEWMCGEGPTDGPCINIYQTRVAPVHRAKKYPKAVIDHCRGVAYHRMLRKMALDHRTMDTTQ